jgi:hypothetical protein
MKDNFPAEGEQTPLAGLLGHSQLQKEHTTFRLCDFFATQASPLFQSLIVSLILCWVIMAASDLVVLVDNSSYIMLSKIYSLELVNRWPLNRYWNHFCLDSLREVPFRTFRKVGKLAA